MDKKDWKEKEKTFLEMQDKAKANKIVVEKQLEELELFLKAIKEKIETFK